MASGNQHFLVTPESCVEDMLSGLAIMYPSLTVDTKSRIILYNDQEEPLVSSQEEEVDMKLLPQRNLDLLRVHRTLRGPCDKVDLKNDTAVCQPIWRPCQPGAQSERKARVTRAIRTVLGPALSTAPLLGRGQTRTIGLLSGEGSGHDPFATESTPRLLERRHTRTVGLLSGGGSGHEPFAAGFVGKGMLRGAVAGKVFTSPPPTTILKAICNVAKISPGGVLVLYNNYTGDCLNFGLAMEKAKLRGLKVKSIVIDDDCAIDQPGGAGKRGLCGCLFFFKIAGGMAELGRSLECIYSECLVLQKHIATFGVTLKPCNMPGCGPMFEIEEGFMELGVGIHGEAGASKAKVADADEIACILVDKLTKTLQLRAHDSVCVIVNNLGGSSQLELYLMAGLVYDQLQKRGVKVARQYTGTLMTSLNMSGIQLSLLLLSSIHRDVWLDILDSQTNAFAWPVTSLSSIPRQQMKIYAMVNTDTKAFKASISDQEANTLRKCLKSAAEALVNNEKTLEELEKGCGDGDTGSSLRRLADVILKDINRLPVNHPQRCFSQLSKMAEEVMGGTAGILYSLMFLGASEKVPNWAVAWTAALETAKSHYSKATLGNRTMFDALIPACKAFETSGGGLEAVHRALLAAQEGCQCTQQIRHLSGRASNSRSLDAGAFAVTIWLEAIYSQLAN